jgi:hypothetical protein
MQSVTDFVDAAIEAVLRLEDEEAFREDLGKNRKIDNVPADYNMKNKYWPLVEANFKKNFGNFSRFIGKFYEKNLDKLVETYPTGNIAFMPSDRKAILEAVGFPDEKEILADVDKYFTDRDKKISKPQDDDIATEIALSLIYRYMLLNKFSLGDIKALCFICGAFCYWKMFRQRFGKQVNVKKMEPVVAAMSDQSSLVRSGSIAEFITQPFYDIKDNERRYNTLIDYRDLQIFHTFELARNKLNNQMTYVSVNYYKYYADVSTVIEISTTKDDDDEGDIMVDMSGRGGKLINLVENITKEFILRDPYYHIYKQIIEPGVNTSQLKDIVSYVKENISQNELYEFIYALMYTYYNEPKFLSMSGNYDSRKFLTLYLDWMRNQYLNRDTYIKNVFKYIDEWCSKGSVTFATTSRMATKSGYRLVVLKYFLFVINDIIVSM